ncbi:MAG TPA: DNA translocase FtsK 4TM domain-containing protein, partial [Burkholderiales bacterium]
MAAAQKTTAAPLPAKLANLLREARWLALAALGGYLLLILLTFDKGDPGWSHSATAAQTHNAGGRAGAWIADLLLYLFGVSAYWWVALCLVAVAWGYRRLDRSVLIDRRPLAIALAGFVLLLLASAALESLRLHTLGAQLPYAPGGMLGAVIGNFAKDLLGFTGATLLLLTLAAVGFSLFTGVSWLAMAELTGLLLESAADLARRTWDSRADRKAGEIAREEREVMVEAEKKREEEHPPLVIAPPPPQIRKSERAQKEKQAPLFEHLPDTPLPPVKLLDEVAHEGEQVSAETLEFTSRL